MKKKYFLISNQNSLIKQQYMYSLESDLEPDITLKQKAGLNSIF